MKNVNPAGMIFMVTGFAGVLLVGAADKAASDACHWEGTAPICSGKCAPGYTQTKTSKTGDGKKCSTGHKAYCCFTSAIHIVGKAPFCKGRCPTGEETVGYQKQGENGNTCVTGSAAICASSP